MAAHLAPGVGEVGRDRGRGGDVGGDGGAGHRPGVLDLGQLAGHVAQHGRDRRRVPVVDLAQGLGRRGGRSRWPGWGRLGRGRVERGRGRSPGSAASIDRPPTGSVMRTRRVPAGDRCCSGRSGWRWPRRRWRRWPTRCCPRRRSRRWCRRRVQGERPVDVEGEDAVLLRRRDVAPGPARVHVGGAGGVGEDDVVVDDAGRGVAQARARRSSPRAGAGCRPPARWGRGGRAW